MGVVVVFVVVFVVAGFEAEKFGVVTVAPVLNRGVVGVVEVAPMGVVDAVVPAVGLEFPEKEGKLVVVDAVGVGLLPPAG